MKRKDLAGSWLKCSDSIHRAYWEDDPDLQSPYFRGLVAGARPYLRVVDNWGKLSQRLCLRSVSRGQLRSIVLNCYLGTHWVERQAGGTFLSPLIFWSGFGEESAQTREYLRLINVLDDMAIKHTRKTNGYVSYTMLASTVEEETSPGCQPSPKAGR